MPLTMALLPLGRRLVSTMTTRILRSTVNDPIFNIATENWIFDTSGPNDNVLYLWQNSPVVVIGRNQNPFKECHLQRMEERGVVLARRLSGGGAVYQDHGNTCFTFVSPKAHFDKMRNYGILTAALQSLGIPAVFSGRNDITVNDRKVSGSAFKLDHIRSLHHGTLLLNVDMTALGGLLNPNKAKLLSKGVASVQARVLNLAEVRADITHASVCSALTDAFLKEYDTACEIEDLNFDQLKEIPSLKEKYNSFQDWDWRFGETPDFNHELEHRFPWGTMDVFIDSKAGVITDCKVFSDCLDVYLVFELEAQLKGKPYSPDGIRQAVVAAQANLSPESQANLADVSAWLVSVI